FLNDAYGVYLTNSPSPSSVTNNTLLNNGLIGIKVAFSNGDVISRNYISGGQYGIYINDESQFATAANNTVVGTSHGIYVRYSPNNNLEQNEIRSKITGIASVSSDYTNILNNTVYDCAHGIELFSSTYNTVFANTAGQNGYGLYLAYANDNTISSNLASNNDWGIRLYESGSNTIIENTFSFNGYGVELISSSTGNTIAWNNILNNTLQMHQDSTSGGNTWNKKTGGTTYGNYWSNYTGEDTDNPPDGVGDTRIPHFGVDYYPLINPWSTIHDVAVVTVTTSDNAVCQGELLNITVVVRNEGTTTETFNVTAKYFNRIIETKLVTNLARLNTTTLVFTWNTQDVPTGFDYEISAVASHATGNPGTGETDKADNAFVDGTVSIEPASLLGDINGNLIVDIHDLHMLAQAFGSTPASPDQWNPDADLNEDNVVDDLDLIILIENYGNTS
ncbi:MAG: NosD domain-containing protein, partial [Promethearchaeota archaeon]